MEDLDEQEVDRLITDIDKNGNFTASAFADELEGSIWGVPASEFGWRRNAQEWATAEGLVEPKKDERSGHTYINFTDRGREFQEKLRARGLTIFVKVPKGY